MIECITTQELPCWNEQKSVWMVCQLKDCTDGSSKTVPENMGYRYDSDGGIVWVLNMKETK